MNYYSSQASKGATDECIIDIYEPMPDTNAEKEYSTLSYDYEEPKVVSKQVEIPHNCKNNRKDLSNVGASADTVSTKHQTSITNVSKLRLIMVIVYMVVFMVVITIASSAITASILTQNIDNSQMDMRNEIGMKQSKSEDLEPDQVPMVYFTMRNPPQRQLVSGKVAFYQVLINVGGGNNKTTGLFTCPVAGLYHFYFQLMQSSTTDVYCYIMYNDTKLGQAETWSDGTGDAASTSSYVHLEVGDIVSVGNCKGWEHVHEGGNEGSFTGALIHV